MTASPRRAALALLAAAGLVLAVPGLASGHPGHDISSDGGQTVEDKSRNAHQHGETDGHLPASSTGNIDVVSKLGLKNVVPEKIADVGVFNDYAYLAAWGVVTCKYNGVHVVNIKDPTQPEEVAFIGSKEGSYPGEGVQALSIDTPAFDGDILVTNNEKCNEKSGFGGMNLYDVSNPEHPTPLAEGVGDTSVAGVDTVSGAGKKAANETHSVFAWDAGDKAYAVIVDNEEGTDVDIMDITNPRKPFLTAEYDLDEEFPQIKQDAPPNLVEIFLHDMVVKEIDGKQVMLLSYWDAGYVKVDMTEPESLDADDYIGDTDFTTPDPEAAESGFTVPPEGNGHQSEFTRDNKYVVGADEDFAPYALEAKNVDDGTAIDASQGSGTRKLEEGQTITGESVFFGRGCNGDANSGSGDGTQIAVVERGLCTFSEKVANVESATGYAAVLIFNRTGTDACDGSLGMSVEGAIPAFGVAPRSQGFAIFGAPYSNDDCLADRGASVQPPAAVGATGDTLTFSSYFDGWGYVHLFDNSAGKMAELDTYAIDEAHDPDFADGFGDLSVHEVATSKEDANRLYFSYYSGGFRVAEVEGGEIVEKGHFIDKGGSNFWGVEVFESGGKEYVAASDRDFGLYIFKYNPTP